MKFLVDQNLPPELAQEIQRGGNRAEHVFYLALGDADDTAIVQLARREDWVIVSRDVDFVQQAGGDDILTWFQLIWIRLGNCSNEQLIAAWNFAWDEIVKKLERGDPVIEVG